MAVPLFAPRRGQIVLGDARERPAPILGMRPSAVAGGGDVSASLERKATGASPLVHGYAREAAALLLLATALFTTLALASFRSDPMRVEIAGPDWVGPAGALVARAGVEAIGVSSWFFPVELGLLAAPLLNGRRSIFGVTRVAGDVVVIFI